MAHMICGWPSGEHIRLLTREKFMAKSTQHRCPRLGRIYASLIAAISQASGYYYNLSRQHS